MSELAHVMQELGSYNAMNLDGGTSTQMVIKGKIVDYPIVKGGGRVTNALLIIQPSVIPIVPIVPNAATDLKTSLEPIQ